MLEKSWKNKESKKEDHLNKEIWKEMFHLSGLQDSWKSKKNWNRKAPSLFTRIPMTALKEKNMKERLKFSSISIEFQENKDALPSSST